MNILLAEPNFPFPAKSKNRANGDHKNFVPIGLLKLGAYHKSLGDKVKLIRGNKTRKELNGFRPEKILITSIFTYWSKYVWDTVQYYRALFPQSEIKIGGIYVTLQHQNPEFKKNTRKYRVKYHVGLHFKAEKFLPDYSLLSWDTDYHLMHGMRGCIRRCKFCGTWKIEPSFSYKNPSEITNEIVSVGKNRVIFLDNNFLANPYKKEILKELAGLKVNGKAVIFESQSGFDGRLLVSDPELANLLKKARFYNVRIAWDHSVKDARLIKKQLDCLIDAGYQPKDISVFMIYNFDISYGEILKKISYCKKWGVQIVDCRYRPLNLNEDNFRPNAWRAGQTSKDYYIHKKGGWNDRRIRYVRKKVRMHNIGTRYGFPYDKKLEKWSSFHNTFKFFKLGRPSQMKEIEDSRLLQKRIQLMNKARALCVNSDLKLPKLEELSGRKIDRKLNRFIKKYNKISTLDSRKIKIKDILKIKK